MLICHIRFCGDDTEKKWNGYDFLVDRAGKQARLRSV